MLRSGRVYFALCLLAWKATAHTFVHSVWVNGVDQGSGVGVRQPAYIGAPLPGPTPFNTDQGSGFRTAPVRDLNSIDMRCNVLGDTPNPYTIKVKSNDIVTFEWHRKQRGDADEVIETSHKGAAAVYISPNPPKANTWVKIQQEGQSAGQWYVAGKLNQRKGRQDVSIPPNLAPGQYLLRSELFTLHESDVSHQADSNRGIQLYISCVQIEVTGSGTVKLPSGVSFPGAYNYSTPGIVYNLYSPPAGSYQIPGPAVWSGAAPSPNAPAYGTQKGPLTQTRWYTWIGTSFSTATARTMLTIATGSATITTAYTPYWPETYVTPAVPPPTPAAAAVTAPVPAHAAPTGWMKRDD